MIARPRVHAKPFAAEGFGAGEGPRDDGVDETTAGIRRRTCNAMQIDVRAALQLSPDFPVIVDRGEHTDERISVDDVMEGASRNLGEDRAVGEVGLER